MYVSFLGGNNYKTISNKGNLKITIQNSDTIRSSLKTTNHLEMYCPLKNPIIITFNKKDSAVIINDSQGNSFDIGTLYKSKTDCNYDCNFYFHPSHKIYFTSKLGHLPYWHGFSALGGLPLFMRYHYYTLKIKNQNGKTLTFQWKYSVHKYKPFGSNVKAWSGDYCEDSGGGLTKLKIKK